MMRILCVGAALLLALTCNSLHAQSCEATETTVCIKEGRFAVSLDWRDSDSNLLSLSRLDVSGTAAGTPRDDEWGYFRFEEGEPTSAIVSILDGRPITGAFWVFFAASTAREYTLTVTDTATDTVRQYFNPLGNLATAIADTQAFPDGGSKATGAISLDVGSAQHPHWGDISDTGRKGEGCSSDGGGACLLDGRFEVSASWRDFDGNTGSGIGAVLEDDASVEFSFFTPENVDVLVDIRDGTSLNGEFWYGVAGLSNVEFTVAVTDLETGLQREYFNPLGATPVAGIDTGPLGTTINSGHSGFWFNAQTPGQGISVEFHPELGNFGFLAYYGFDAAAAKVGASDQRWITGQGNYEGDTLSMALFSTSGGQFNGSQSAETTEVGTAEFTVTDCRTATVQINLDEGVSGEIPLERLLPQSGGIVDLCSAVSLGASVP